MMTISFSLSDIVDALVDALKGPSTGVFSPLAILARPMYPWREFSPQLTPDGKEVMLHIFKWGRHYKNRGRKQTVPPANTEGIKMALNLRLPESIRVKTVSDEGDYILIVLEVSCERNSK